MSDSTELKKETRGRKKKNPNPIPNPLSPLVSADSDTNENNPPGVIALDIEGNAPESTPGSWKEKLQRAAESVGLLDDEPTDRIETRGRKKKGAVQDEFSTLVVALLTLGVSFANVPDQVKPNQSELSIFSNHLTGIMIRHLPISNKFSADSLDIIGLVAVCSGWYARVAPEIKAMNKGNDSTPPPPHPGPKTPIDPPPAPGNDIEKYSPKTAAFLDSVIAKAQENDNDSN